MFDCNAISFQRNDHRIHKPSLSSMSKFYTLLTLVAAFYIYGTYGVNAQKTSLPDYSETQKLISGANEVKGKETGALIILKDYVLTINEKNEKKLVLRVVGKIFSKEALLDYSTIPINYNSYYEDLTLNYARVFQKDGTVREVPKDAVQIKTTPESQGLQYTDYKYLSFALPGLETGAGFDYQVTVTDKVQQMEAQCFDSQWLGGMLISMSPPYTPRFDPVTTSRYTIFMPAGAKIQYHLYSSSIEPVKEKIGGQVKYQWVLNDIPSIKAEEAMPSLGNLNPNLIITSLEDWGQLDKWATEKILSKIEVTDELNSRARQLTDGLTNEDDKIKAIANFIQNNIRYIYADLDRGGFTPHRVNEILHSKYGDCKDKSILLVSMLKAVGIEAYPALINPFPYDETKDLPTLLYTH